MNRQWSKDFSAGSQPLQPKSSLHTTSPILSHVGANGYFAETYACIRDAVMPVDVTASEDCEILFLSVALMER